MKAVLLVIVISFLACSCKSTKTAEVKTVVNDTTVVVVKDTVVVPVAAKTVEKKVK